MSETPQERIEKWLAEGHWVKEVDEPERGIRKAIQAVLARLAAFEAGQKPLEGDSRSRVLRRLGVADADEALEKIDRLYMAEAENSGYRARLAQAEAERDALTEKLSLVTEDYIKERNAATTAEAELRRAEKLWGAAQARADVANVALLDAVKVQGQLRVARAALGEWREAESSPDCIACCTLDAALAGPQP